MRDREHRGRYHSMPSGDAAAGAFICIQLAYLFNCPMVLVAIPLTCLGRVYVQCHWFGDTLAGTVIGCVSGYLAYNVYFEGLGPHLYVTLVKILHKGK